VAENSRKSDQSPARAQYFYFLKKKAFSSPLFALTILQKSNIILNMRPREVIKILETKGWQHERTSGSHYIMTKQGRRPVPIPFHGNGDLDPKFVRMLEKQTGEKLL